MPLYQVINIINDISMGRMIQLCDLNAVVMYLGGPLDIFQQHPPDIGYISLQLNLLLMKRLMEKGFV